MHSKECSMQSRMKVVTASHSEYSLYPVTLKTMPVLDTWKYINSFSQPQPYCWLLLCFTDRKLGHGSSRSFFPTYNRKARKLRVAL